MDEQQRCLVEVLDYLKISSRESVENIESFSSFKEYIHVERAVQNELLSIIQQSSEVNQSQLILVCGSVGDGKSHLLSYLKHHHVELLENFRLYNDASESFNPEDTDMDTLNRELEVFSDEKIGQNEIHKIILAINLGTLSNFIESKYKDRYMKLREFVYNHRILDNHVGGLQQYKENSNFQYINFTDYHMYTLTEKGPRSIYIQDLLKKLVEKEAYNPFYQAYKENCYLCKHRARCVVRENYKLIGKEAIQQGIIQVLIATMIKEKLIISTRELLNFFNDLLVGGLDRQTLMRLNKKSNGLEGVLEQKNYLLPNILFAKIELSGIIEKTSKLDPLIIASKQLEEELMRYQLTDGIIQSIREDLTELSKKFTTYIAQCISEAEFEGMSQARLIDIRYEFFRLYKRTKFLMEHGELDSVYNTYMKNLYYSNKVQLSGLKELYKETRDNIYRWDGSLGAKGVRVSSSKKHRKLGIYELLDLKPYIDKSEQRVEDELEKFVTNIILTFSCDRKKTPCQLNIDYGVYELLKKMTEGYLPNKEEQDKNIVIQSFIQQLLDINRLSKEEEVLIFESIGEEHTIRYKLEVNDFGEYEFNKVM